MHLAKRKRLNWIYADLVGKSVLLVGMRFLQIVAQTELTEIVLSEKFEKDFPFLSHVHIAFRNVTAWDFANLQKQAVQSWIARYYGYFNATMM